MARTPYWNIDYGVLIDVLAIPVMAILIYGLYLQVRRIRQGQIKISFDPAQLRGLIRPIYLSAMITKGLLGAKIYKDLFAGFAHGILWWGMLGLAAGTGLVMLNVVLHVPVFSGGFNRWVMSWGLDLAGVMVLLGLVFFSLRRIFPPERLIIPKEREGFLPVIAVLGLVIITGFLVEGLRIAQNGPDAGAFVGNWIGGALANASGLSFFHRSVWWLHGLFALGFIAWLPFSPMVHLFLAPANTALANPQPGTNMGVIDFSSFENENAAESEDAGSMPILGVAKLADFSSKRRLDFATCLWCGRCHEVCPAAQTKQALSPKGVLLTLAEYLAAERFGDESLVEAVGIDAIFNCTTCAACMEACPVGINQPKSILRLRQNLVMERSEIPELMGKALNSLEQRRHPFFGTGAGPRDWQKGLESPLFEAGQTEYLLWIGCAVTYDERAQKIARAMVNILKAGGVSFGVLETSRCTGDPAKQMGNEFLFVELARENIVEFEELGVKKIITLCPHCYNTFTRHYPILGGAYQVIPHAVLISDLIASYRLKLSRGKETICFHDPCYLARHNHIMAPPRKALSAVGNIVEMPRNKKESFCCGGGGGNYWSEASGIRINQVRAQEALSTGAGFIATSCPFCLLMLTDGAKKFTEEEKVFDIAELIDRRLKIDG
jgi:Fe-S oxidoreductase/nitrate reductase gamma subunit